MLRHLVFFFLAFVLSSITQAALPTTFESEGQKIRFETLLERDGVIWGFDFLPDGRILFTERSGQMAVFDPKVADKKKAVQALTGIPKVWAEGQGGLLDVRVHPDFAKNQIIFFTYSEPVGRGATTAVGRAKIVGSELKEFKKIFSAHEPNTNEIHFGSRILFEKKADELLLFVSIGDRNERKFAQDLKYHNGKILRLREDGSPAPGNPFEKTKDAKPEIWSLGHRSPQGLTRQPSTGDIYLVEMGPRGGDELNRIEPGKNYGWPIITYGREYYGPKIGEGTAKPGLEQPIAHWVPSISPSGSNFYDGEAFPKWKGNLFLGTLSSQHLRRLAMDGAKVIKQEELLKDSDLRVRNVRQGPEGYLYLSTDTGLLSRLVPAK